MRSGILRSYRRAIRQFRAHRGTGTDCASNPALCGTITNVSSWTYGTMSKETQRSPDRLDWDIRVADALELARQMPPGRERSEALKLASLLRCTADARGLIFAKRGRPRK